MKNLILASALKSGLSTGKTSGVPRWIMHFLAIIIFLGLSSLAHAQLHIEQVQRDFQVRYHLLNAPTNGANNTNFIDWPRCGVGTGATPHYPKDGYYGDLSLDLSNAVLVVQDLASNFYENNVIYTSFVNSTNKLADLNGASSIVNFTSADMLPYTNLTSITTNNYPDVLLKITQQMALLNYIQKPAIPVVASNYADTRLTVSSIASSTDHCAAVKDCVTNHSAATPWGSNYFLNVEDSCNVSSQGSFIACATEPVEITNFVNNDGFGIGAAYQRPAGKYLLVIDHDGRMDNWDISGTAPSDHDHLALGDIFRGEALDFSVKAGQWLVVSTDPSTYRNTVHLIGFVGGTSNLVDEASTVLENPFAGYHQYDDPQSVACDNDTGEGYILTEFNLFSYDTVEQETNAQVFVANITAFAADFVVPDVGTTTNVPVNDSTYFAVGEWLSTAYGTFQVTAIPDATHITMFYSDLAENTYSGETDSLGDDDPPYMDYSSSGNAAIGYNPVTEKVLVARSSGGNCLIDVFQTETLEHLKTTLLDSLDESDVDAGSLEQVGGCIFNPQNGLLYVAVTVFDGSDGHYDTKILVVSPSTWALVATIAWPHQLIQGISYNPFANQLLAATSSDSYVSDARSLHTVCCYGNSEVGNPLDISSGTGSSVFWGQSTFASTNNLQYMPLVGTTRAYGFPPAPCQPPTNIARVFEYYQNTDPNDSGLVDYSAVAINTRGKISCDLTQYLGGSNQIFLKLVKPPSGENWNQCAGAFGSISITSTFGEDGPTSTGENTYGAWTNGILTNGFVSTTSNYVTASDIVPAAAGSCSAGPDKLYGWVLGDAIVVVAPDFTVDADKKCCSGCVASCNGGTDVNASISGTGAIQVDAGLGSDNFGTSAGSLDINATAPSPALYTPSYLAYTLGTNVQAINDTNGIIRQFKSSQILVDIVTNGSTNYTMSYYTADNAGTTNGNGIYVPTGSPYTTITVQNPDASLTVFNRLQIVGITDGNTNMTEYNYQTANNQWSMTKGNGTRTETHAFTWDSSGTVKTDVMTISNGVGQLVYEESNTYVQYSWGQEMVANVVDPDGAALTSLWVYYTNAAVDGGNYRELAQQIGANGHWITYQYDQYGRETNRIEQFLNSSLGSGAGSNRQTITIYSNGVPQITTIQKLLGTESGRSYEVVDIGLDEHIQCQTAGANWSTATDNLVTITTQYTSGPFTRQLQSVQNPDGTVALYFYSTNATQKTTIVLTGQPDPSNATNILAGGTVTTTVTALGGQVLSSTTQYKVSSSSYITTSQDTYTYLDDLMRSYQDVHLNGTSNYVFYACCGLDSEIDADGVATAYAHDGLKRQIASTRNGITVSNMLDALGNALLTIRNPGASQIVQHGAVYDLVGRLVVETNALGGITSYTNYFDGAGQLVRVTTNADLGTRIETYAQDGSLLSVSGTAARPLNYQYGVDGDGAYTATIKYDPGSGNTNEWTKVSSDMVGRAYKTTYPSASGNHAATSYFNNLGQLSKEVDPDGITHLYTYNGLGQVDLTAVDINQNGSIETSGPDRISETIADVVNDGTIGANVQRTRNYVYVDGSSTPLFVSMNETSTDGLKSWNTVYNHGTAVTRRSVTVYSTGGYRYQTNFATDNSYRVRNYLNGQLISVVQKDFGNNQIGGTTYGYDAFGRENTSQDARNGTTTYYFNNADQTSGMLSPSPDGTLSGQVTSNFFDNMGRITGTILPDNSATTNLYYVTGDLMLTHGSRTYPVGYSYDAQGRMKTMTNWSGFATLAGARVTTWNYNTYSGLLSGKTYDGGTAGPSYSYTAAGRLNTRTWARGITTTYGYNTAGGLTTVTYDDGTTPGITNGYDRQGRQTIITNGATVCSLTYNDANQVLSESYAGGPLDTVSITNGYDGLLRRTNCVTRFGSTVVTSTTNNYDAASRLSFVSDGTNSATYSYLANSPLVQYITFRQSGTTRMTTTKNYDYLNRLTSISSANASSVVLDSHNYAYNNANQRTAMTNSDNTRWNYFYDALGQVTSGSNYWGDGTLVAGRQYTYAFDDIGNRTSASFGGDTNGSNLRSATYTANNLNQYNNRTVPGYLEIEGSATNTATVTVNGQSTYRKTNYYWAELTVANGSSAVLQEVTNQAVLSPGPNGTINGSTFVPKTPENFTYDLDGNLTSDGRWTNIWDAENRLVSMTNLPAAPSGSETQLDFTYDYKGRRIQKTVSTWNGSIYVPQSTNRFVYDGWNTVATLNPVFAVTRSFMWGLDLSGTIKGSGGVGGLLEVSSLGTNSFVTFDGSGNVSLLINSVDSTLMAQYEFGPFGELVRVTGPMAQVNPFRFSTKYFDEETASLYFPHRYYSPSIGRWINRDPAGENAHYNLYATKNSMGVDPLGLFELKYINYPQWIPAPIEYFWTGYYLNFSSEDAAALSAHNDANDHDGIFIYHIHSSITISDASGRNSVSRESKDYYYAQAFRLDSGGSLLSANYPNKFTDNQLHMFIEPADIKLLQFLQRRGKSVTYPPEAGTQGHFSAVGEVRVVIGTGTDLENDSRIAVMGPNNRFDPGDIEGHETGGDWYGYTLGSPPSAWDYDQVADQNINVDFSWDDCGSNHEWNFKASPKSSRGETRDRYKDSPPGAGTINLIDQPNSDNTQ